MLVSSSGLAALSLKAKINSFFPWFAAWKQHPAAVCSCKAKLSTGSLYPHPGASHPNMGVSWGLIWRQNVLLSMAFLMVSNSLQLFLAATAHWTNDIGELSRVNPTMPSPHRDGSDYFPLDSLWSVTLELRFIYSHRFLRSFWGSPPPWWHLTAQKPGDLPPHPICVAGKGTAEGMLSLDGWQRSRYCTLSSALFESALKESEGSFLCCYYCFTKTWHHWL